MPDTIDQFKISCKRARAAMQRAKDGHYAIGAFNIDNAETLTAIARAAKKLNAPVMVELSQSEVDVLGLANVRDLVDNTIQEYGVEMYINLDHSPSVAAAKKGIDAGFEFIHIDISQAEHDASDEAIVEATKQVVDYAAKTTGALVESEPHYFQGGSNVFNKDIDYEEVRKTFSTADGAREFVVATGIDTFAAAVGNLHGKYNVPKRLDLELLAQIRAAIACNISLHGGSDTPGSMFEEAVKIGVTKINVNSDLRFAYRTTLEEQLKDNPEEFAIIKLEEPVIAAVQAVVEEKISFYNSTGKALL